jgi:hypothetical protein
MIIILATNKEFLEKKHSGRIPTVQWEVEGQGGYAVDVMSLRGQFCGLIAYRQEQKIPRQLADYSS